MDIRKSRPRDSERALIVLNELKRLGVKLALDDFGTGYSSLGHLMRFPLDVVKIDRSFIAGLANNPASQTIVVAILQLAHSFGMTVVAEGVESADQHHQLTELGCDFCQGFYFAPPTSDSGLTTLIHTLG